MPCRILFQIGALLSILLGGCSSVTMTQLVADGKQPLSQKQLASLIPNATIHLESIDFDGEIHFQADGRLVGKNRQNETEKGKWEINKENQLCMKFAHWYYGESRCYRIINEDADTYIFFTANGARMYTGRMQSGQETSMTREGGRQPGHDDPPGPAPATRTAIATAEKRDSDGSRAPKLSEQEMKISLQYLARNCPGCNLSGTDLQNAQLIDANLAGADLAKIDLSGANLRRANLAGANLSGARLVRANLAGADLSGCNLAGADLTGSNLIRANMTAAKLEGAILTGTLLENIQGMNK